MNAAILPSYCLSASLKRWVATSSGMLAVLIPGANLAIRGAEHPLKLSDFTPAEECAVCHQEIYQQWRGSWHAQATSDKLFNQMLTKADSDLRAQGKTAGFCLTCHAPLATIAKEVRVSEPVVVPLNFKGAATQGVTCDFCHTISGNENFGKDISSGVYRYPRKGETSIKYGVHADAQSTNHLTKATEFLKSAELCGICHKFTHPLSGEKVQDTYEEWRSGPYSKPGGKRCQDCHMPEFAGHSAEGAMERTNLHAHVFPGGHSELVKKVATVTALATITGKSGKGTVNLKALVKNVGSGHYMPTGLPGMRQMWLEVAVGDQQGATVFANKSPIGIEALGPDGKPTMPWNAVRFGKDTRIGPQKTQQTAWTFPVPETNPGPFEMKVAVFYRSISELAAQAAGVEPSPPIQIASDRLRFFKDGRIERLPVE